MSNTSVHDALSDFRAFSRAAGMKLHVFNGYSYTIETIVEAGREARPSFRCQCAPMSTCTPPRLVESLGSSISRQVLTMLGIFINSCSFAVWRGLVFALGFLISARFLYFYLTGWGGGHG